MPSLTWFFVIIFFTFSGLTAVFSGRGFPPLSFPFCTILFSLLRIEEPSMDSELSSYYSNQGNPWSVYSLAVNGAVGGLYPVIALQTRELWHLENETATIGSWPNRPIHCHPFLARDGLTQIIMEDSRFGVVTSSWVSKSSDRLATLAKLLLRALGVILRKIRKDFWLKNSVFTSWILVTSNKRSCKSEKPLVLELFYLFLLFTIKKR